MPAASSNAQRIDAERLEALPQHLAALAEGRLGHALERAAIAGERLRRAGSSRTTDDVTFGGGTKARRRDVEQDLRLGAPAGEHGRAGRRPSLPGAATMRSATSRWNISTSRSYQGGHGSAVSQCDQQRGRDVVGQVGDDARAAAGEQRRGSNSSASPATTSSRPG